MGWIFVITEEMRATGLTGNDLIIYSIISSCTLSGNGCYHGGAQFLAQVTGVSRRSAYNVLNRLVDSGLVQEVPGPDGRTPAYQSVNVENDVERVCKNCTNSAEECAKIAQSCAKIAQKTPILSLSYRNTGSITQDKLNNKINNNIYTHNAAETSPQKVEKPAARFTRPTLEEVAAYVQEKGYHINPESFVDFYDSKGWRVGSAPMKDWRAAVRNWERMDKERAAKRGPQVGPVVAETEEERYLRTADAINGTHRLDEHLAAKARFNAEREAERERWRQAQGLGQDYLPQAAQASALVDDQGTQEPEPAAGNWWDKL